MSTAFAFAIDLTAAATSSSVGLAPRDNPIGRWRNPTRIPRLLRSPFNNESRVPH